MFIAVHTCPHLSVLLPNRQPCHPTPSSRFRYWSPWGTLCTLSSGVWCPGHDISRGGDIQFGTRPFPLGGGGRH